jgi:predicted house-cleaning noncanonical NTP pyrophosphatase (MazG superfamily)
VTEVLRFRVEKLIRDRLPAMMRAQGLTVFERPLDDAAYLDALKAKLVEEAEEARSAGPDDLAGELADVLEVVLALAAAQGVSREDLEALRLRKREARGGFDARIYNEAVECRPDAPGASYYIGRYPLAD